MANHLHKQVRDAVKTALTGLAATGSRVYANRLQPMADANLPGLRISADEESAEALLIHAAQLQDRTLTFSVECCAKAASALDDTLDQISKEVEVALAGGITISTRVLPVTYQGMNYEDDLSDKPVGVKRLRFSISYTSAASAPDTLS